MKKYDLLVASALALVIAAPAAAQDAAAPDAVQDSAAPQQEFEPAYGDIVVTAQRQAQRLQDVPIAVSAFTGENLEQQQIVNPTALQLTLPNITYTKTNFTSSSFTIRGIGDLCVGVACDSATAIHVNDMPLLSTRLFESEFYDLERIEVLRGPQGTLFGRNATSGVVNFITAKADLSGFHASGDFEYGNYDSKQVKGMINVPLGDTLGVRVAGIYLNRDGYTTNTYTGNKIDGRDLFSLRGTISYEPTADTRIDLIAYYFREDDNRSRIQKQQCHRDPTGVLGCLPDRLGNDTVNGDASLATLFTSREFLTLRFGGTALQPIIPNFALGSIYGTDGDVFTGFVSPAGVRNVSVDFEPTYFAEEQQYTAKIFHDFGPVSLTFTGGYMKNEVRSRTDYSLSVQRSLANNPGLLTLYGASLQPSPFQGVFQGVVNTLFPGGPGRGVCQSDADPAGVGVFGGNSIGCFPTSLDFDESSQRVEQYSAEVHAETDFDGMFNFLIGGIYFDSKTISNSYFVNSFGLDYAAALLGAGQTIGARAAGATTYPLVFTATPFYRNNSEDFRLKSYGLFGEAYFDFGEAARLTLGLRYNHDQKSGRSRNSLLVDSNGNGVFVPYGSDSITDALNYATADYDALTPGRQEFAFNDLTFEKLTGRAVFDYKITRDNLVYASYSRGYKSGGFNPPLSPSFAVPATFEPEQIDAFELGSKNSFGNGQFRLNLTGFYYKYKGLQLSQIVSRTSVNYNVNADIYGLEAEAILSPIPAFVVNMNFSYLKSKITSDQALSNPRDPSGGRSDAVIIKDVTAAANCGVLSRAGSATAANTFVATVNGIIGTSVGNPALLRPPVPVPGTTTTGAFSVCSALTGAAANGLAALSAVPAVQAQLAGLQLATFGVSGALPFTVYGTGVPVNIKGNELPQAPRYKFSVGAQYTIGMGDMSLVPRVDLAYTAESFGNFFNLPIDRMQGYEVINAQVTLNGADDRWYLRAFVQNLTENDATTGQYVGDQASGLYTNIFTLEPRRYGLSAGFRF